MSLTNLKISSAIFLFLVVKLVKPQVYPDKVVALNHVQIMFQYPQVKGAQIYKIRIAKKTESAFDKNIIYEAIDSATAHLVSQKIKFGNKYCWKYEAYTTGKKIFSSKEFVFETANTKVENMFKANITKYDSSKSLPGLVFLDNGVVIDRKGNLILISDSFGVEKRDFTMTLNGSITYLRNGIAIDQNLNGDIIWKSPKIKNDKYVVFDYHHDITKLKNGNYLSLCKVNDANNESFNKKFNEAIIELDSVNNVVWLWREIEHITDTTGLPTSHLNSIYLDEKENKIFVSARDFNTVFTVNRKTRKIDECIGKKINKDSEHYPQEWFSGQHSAQLVDNGNIILFNNNTMPGRGNVTSIMEMNRPNPQKRDIEMIFFYFYDFGKGENFCAKGGDINKLKNNNYLVSSSSYNRNFEMTANQEIVWECRPERLDTVSKTWSGMGSYRINFLETLYPSFFTLEFVYSNNKLTGFKIVNKGSSDDEYEIVMKNPAGKVIETINKVILAGNGFRKTGDFSNTASIKVIPKSHPLNAKEKNVQ